MINKINFNDLRFLKDFSKVFLLIAGYYKNRFKREGKVWKKSFHDVLCLKKGMITKWMNMWLKLVT